MSYDDDFIDDNDDDVFAKSPSSSGSTSDSSEYGVNMNAVPGYLRNALDRYFRENPQIQDSYKNFRDSSVITQFISLFTVFDQTLCHFAPGRFKHGWSHLRALIQVLDTQYEGLIQRLSLAYDLELQLQLAHANYVNVVEIHTVIDKHPQEPTKLSVVMLRHLGALADIYRFSIDSTVRKYIDACEAADFEPDKQLVDFGIKAEGDYAYASTNSRSQVSVHYRYGDVSSVGASNEESYRSAFIKFLLPIIFADEKTATELLESYASPS